MKNLKEKVKNPAFTLTALDQNLGKILIPILRKCDL